MSHRAHPAWGVVFQLLPSWGGQAGTVLHPMLPPHHQCHLHPPSQGSPSAFLIPLSHPQHFAWFPNPLLGPLSLQLVFPFFLPFPQSSSTHSFTSSAHNFMSLHAYNLLFPRPLSCQAPTNLEIPSEPIAWGKILLLGYICLLNK